MIFEILDGVLKITPREVTLTSGDGQKVYDGTALTNHTVTVTNGEFVGDDGFTANVTGSQTLVGSSENTFTYGLTGTETSNYVVKVVYGTLTVTEPDDGVVEKTHEQSAYKLGDEVTFLIVVENIYDEVS